jgi:hypothetical protein
MTSGKRRNSQPVKESDSISKGKVVKAAEALVVLMTCHLCSKKRHHLDAILVQLVNVNLTADTGTDAQQLWGD